MCCFILRRRCSRIRNICPGFIPHEPMNSPCTMKCSLRLVLLLVLVTAGAQAQVNIYPKRVMVSNSQRSSDVLVSNTGVAPVEISAKALFAIIRSDSLGNTYFDSTGSDAEMARSCHGWAKVFPKQFTLLPGEERTVRVIMTPPASLGDGEYRARLMISSAVVEPPLTPEANDTAVVITDVRLRIHSSLPLIFRKGKVETGIAITSLAARHVDSNLSLVVADLGVTGNSAYRGTVQAVLRSADGSRLDTASEQVTVELNRRQALPFRRIAEGTYRLDVSSRAVFTGTAMESVLAAPPVEQSYDLVVSRSEMILRPRVGN